MARTIGDPTECPNCMGGGKLDKGKRCSVCNGYGRVEYQEGDGQLAAPAGSWLPTPRRGKTGYQIVLFGGKMQKVVR